MNPANIPPGPGTPCRPVHAVHARETLIQTVPVFTLGYILNQDASGLSAQEIALIDQFLAGVDGWWPVVPQGEPFFSASNDIAGWVGGHLRYAHLS